MPARIEKNWLNKTVIIFQYAIFIIPINIIDTTEFNVPKKTQTKFLKLLLWLKA